MLQRLFPLLLVGSTLLAATPAQANEPWAPLEVVATEAIVDGTKVVVLAWTPGTQVADYYKIYGIDGDAITFLGIGTGTTTTSSSTFDTYAVSGILDGLESVPIDASAVPCFNFSAGPPPDYVLGWCDFNGAGEGIVPSELTVQSPPLPISLG